MNRVIDCRPQLREDYEYYLGYDMDNHSRHKADKIQNCHMSVWTKPISNILSIYSHYAKINMKTRTKSDKGKIDIKA